MEQVELNYKGVTLEVEGDYTPYDSGVWRYPDGSGQPPSAAEFSITSIMLGYVDVWELLEDNLEEVEELCIRKITE